MKNLEELLKIKQHIVTKYFDGDPGWNPDEQNLAPPLMRNFVGVGVGYRLKGEELTKDPCVTVLVRAKLPEKYLGDYNVKVDSYGEAVDVVAVGGFRAAQCVAPPVSASICLAVGSDVAMATGIAHGTLCLHVADNYGTNYLLSCRHVLDSHSGAFRLVTSRSEVVAKIARESILFPGSGGAIQRQQDATIAALVGGVLSDNTLPDGSVLSSKQPVPPVNCTPVIKYGKTVRDGMILVSHARVEIDYPTQTCLLENQIVMWSQHYDFAELGDSGSLIVTEGLCPVGMLIGAGDPVSLMGRYKRGRLPPSFSIAAPLETVLNDFQVHII